MKQKLLLKTMLLLFALIAGSSSVWADDYELYSGTITEGDYVIYYSGKAMKNSIASNRLQYTEVTPSDNKITDPDESIVWHIAASGDYWTIYNASVLKYAASTGSNNQAKLEGSVTSNSKWTVTEPATGTYEFENLARADASSNNKWLRNNGTYGFACYASGTGGALSLYKKSAAAPTKVSKPSISGNEVFLTSTEVSITCSTTGAAIQYSTDGTSWNNYSAPFTLTETTTVIAKATKSGLAASDEASKTFTKVTSTTVAAALTAINALADNKTIENQCVAGTISQVDYYSSNAITYWISDDGTTTSQLEVYNGKGLNGANFTAKTDLNVGDQVTVFGTLKKYVSGTNTTPEFDAGSQLLSYSATGAPTPAINASAVIIDADATSGEITYTIDNPTAASLTAAVKEGDWISNVQVDAVNSKVTFSVTQNTGEQRIGYITLSYEGATSKDVKVTQKATYGTATLPFAFDGGKADIESTDGLTHTGLGSDYGYSPKLKFDNTDDFLILRINGAAQKLYFDIKGNSFSGGTFEVQTSADGVTYTELKSYTELGAVSHESLDLASTVRYIKWIYTSKSSGNVALGRIGIDCEAAYIPSAGYATYTTPNDVDFTGTGITAYKVSVIGASNVTLEEVTEAPAGTPLVLQATAGNYALKIVASAAAVSGNKLLVSDGTATTTDANTVYALASKGDPAVVGFYKVKAGTKVPAGKGYLSVAVTSAPEYLGFDGDGNTTSVSDVRSKMEEGRGEFYNLAGQRVAQPTKGLYIVNGKKYIVK